VKAIRDLHSLGRATACSVSIGPGTVATDHFDAGMILQPLAQGGRLTIGQERNRRVTFYVNQHRTVALAFAVRPIIDA
jgi:hypothetical protein